MAEVLSQSQIDALLNAFNSGDKSADNPPDTQNEKKYRKYDFTNPRKFAKDRIKMLNGVFDNYTRVISSRLNGLLRINCEASVESIEEQRYYEFSNALTEGDVLAIAQAHIKGTADDSPVMLYMSTTTALSMMDRMMGGEGEFDEEIDPDYAYTNLELGLYESMMKDLIKSMGSSWENYLAIEFAYARTEVNPTLVQMIGLDEIVIIVDMKLEMENGTGRMSVCLPAALLTNIFAEINRENPGRKVSGEDKSEEIFERLRDSDLEVVAHLGETELSLRDIYHLNVGDVIDLGQPKDSAISLSIGGYQWFAGRMGTYKKNMAVKIDEVCYQAEEKERVD